MVKELEATLRTGKELAEYINELSYDELPIEVVHQVKRLVIDCLGTIFMGIRKPEAQPISQLLSNLNQPEECTVAKTIRKTSCPWAAFANASYSQVHDCNDGHRDAAAFGGSAHPGRTVIPTALAVGELLGSSGEDVVNSIVIGYDVATKIRGMENRPPAATYSSAAVASKLMGLSTEEIQFAMGIAGFISPKGFPRSLAYDTNFLSCGYQAKNGIEAAMMAKEGLGGQPLGDDRRLSTRFRERGLGQDYEVMNVYIKPWPTCRMTHGAIDALLDMNKEETINFDDIDEIKISQLTHGMYIKDTPVDVDSYYKACQFNLPYIAAITILDGEVTEAQFTSERIADERIHELAKKVKITADESLDSIYPDKDRPTTVKVVFKDGKSIQREILRPYGDPRNTLNDAALYKKFVKWSGSSISSEQAHEIKEIVWTLEDQLDLESLMALIRG